VPVPPLLLAPPPLLAPPLSPAAVLLLETPATPEPVVVFESVPSVLLALVPPAPPLLVVPAPPLLVVTALVVAAELVTVVAGPIDDDSTFGVVVAGLPLPDSEAGEPQPTEKPMPSTKE
jgi:hypothetical protein